MIKIFLDLGLQPLANKYLTKKDLVKKKGIYKNRWKIYYTHFYPKNNLIK